MANLKPNHFNISKGLFSTEIWRYRGTTIGTTSISLIDVQRNWKRKRITRTNLKSRRRRGYDNVIQCCSVVSSTSSSATEEEVDQLELNEKYGNRKGQFGNLVTEYGWQVRRMVEKDDEMRKVAQVQAEAFYEPLIFFNDLFFDFFKVGN